MEAGLDLELWQVVFSHCDLFALLTIRTVCKTWSALAKILDIAAMKREWWGRFRWLEFERALSVDSDDPSDYTLRYKRDGTAYAIGPITMTLQRQYKTALTESRTVLKLSDASCGLAFMYVTPLWWYAAIPSLCVVECHGTYRNTHHHGDSIVFVLRDSIAHANEDRLGATLYAIPSDLLLCYHVGQGDATVEVLLPDKVQLRNCLSGDMVGELLEGLHRAIAGIAREVRMVDTGASTDQAVDAETRTGVAPDMEDGMGCGRGEGRPRKRPRIDRNNGGSGDGEPDTGNADD